MLKNSPQKLIFRCQLGGRGWETSKQTNKQTNKQTHKQTEFIYEIGVKIQPIRYQQIDSL